MQLPFNKVFIWLLSLLAVAGLPATSMIYFPAILEAGVLDPDADTIIIPMINSIILAIILAPCVGVVVWLSIRNSPRFGWLLAWNHDRPLVSALISTPFVLVLIGGVWLLYVELTAPAGWFGWLWLPWTLIFMAWACFVRAAAVSGLRSKSGNGDAGQQPVGA